MFENFVNLGIAFNQTCKSFCQPKYLFLVFFFSTYTLLLRCFRKAQRFHNIQHFFLITQSQSLNFSQYIL